MKKTFTVAAITMCLASAALAQPYPNNGTIGIYGSFSGTGPCCGVPTPFQPFEISVWASLAGLTITPPGAFPAGIQGAEFRIDASINVNPVPFATVTVDPAFNVTLGTMIDWNPTDQTTAGFTIAGPSCRPNGPSGALPGDRVHIADLSLVFLGAPAPFDLIVKGHSTPANPNFRCPLFVLCDDPTFTKVCMTVTTDENGGEEPIAFRYKLGTADCGNACGPVAVANATWSGVKGLFR